MKSNRWFVVMVTMFLCLMCSLARGQDQPPGDPQAAPAYCNPPKQEGMIKVLAVAALAFMVWALYTCAKKAVDGGSPPPPPPPPSNGGTNNAARFNLLEGYETTGTFNPDLFQWGGPFDYSECKDSMAGMPYSTTNAFIHQYVWNNQEHRDADGNLYNAWASGVLPIETSTNLLNWSRSMTVTQYISPGAVFSIFYDNGVKIAESYTGTSPGSLTEINLGFVRKDTPKGFARLIPKQ